MVVLVVGAAVLGGRFAGVATAISAALSFNFFLTDPRYTLRVGDTRDIITIALLVVVGLVVGELAILRMRSRAEVESVAGSASRLERLVALAAEGTSATVVWQQLTGALGDVVGLQSCRFVVGELPAGPLRLERTGTVDTQVLHYVPRAGFELPTEGLAIPVALGGQLIGHVVGEPTLGRGVSLAERRLALALVDVFALVHARFDLTAEAFGASPGLPASPVDESMAQLSRRPAEARR
jgi:hypothetical protein